MATVQEQAAALQEEIRVRDTWYSFAVTNRQYWNEANRQELDAWLTANMKIVSAENLAEALAACRPRLGVNDLSHQVALPSLVKATPTPAVVIADDSPDAALPAEYTRKVIIDMDRDSYKKILKEFGEEAILYRVNFRKEVK